MAIASIFVPPRSTPMRICAPYNLPATPIREDVVTSQFWIRAGCAGALAALLGAAGCSVSAPTTKQPAGGAASAADAKTFLDRVSADALRLGISQSQAGWVQQTYITDDTNAI